MDDVPADLEARMRLARISTLILCILSSIVSIYLMLSWKFELTITLDAIISHSESVTISILDMAAHSGDEMIIVYTILNALVLFSILSILSPRFTLIPPFLFLLSGYLLSGDFSGDLNPLLKYSLDTSGAMGYAISCSVATMVIALLANLTMRMDAVNRSLGLLYNTGLQFRGHRCRTSDSTAEIGQPETDDARDDAIIIAPSWQNLTAAFFPGNERRRR